MIATCPACGKRYRLADEAVPSGGRAVRCAACGNGWTAMPAPLAGVSRSAPPPADDTGASAGAALGRAAFAASASEAVAPDAGAVPYSIAHGHQASFGIVAPDTATVPADASTPDLADSPNRREPRRRWLAPVAAAAVLALGAAAAVVLLAPQVLPFDTARLGLPVVTLPAVALPAFNLPRPDLAALPRVTISFPPLDLTRVPYIGADLDRWFDPPPVPASPLRIDVTAERRRLGNGTRLLVVSGEVANPTASSHSVPPIEATLADAAGRVALRWRIAAPVARLDAGRTAAFESVAANYPDGSPRLRLVFAPE